LVSFNFAWPATFADVVNEFGFAVEAFSPPRRELGCGDELGAGEVEVAFTWTFLRQAQAVSEFQFDFVEVGLEPVDRLLVELAGADGVGLWPARTAPGCRAAW
jgi:hypothetical protein